MKVDCIYCTRTYAGCYEGKPPRDVIEHGFIEQIRKMWGRNRPILNLDDKTQELGMYQWAAWLDSGAIVEGDGSHLVVVWSSDDEPEINCKLPVIDDRTWRSYAENYEI